STPATHDFDLKTATVTGNVTLNGKVLPDNTLSKLTRGRLVFTDPIATSAQVAWAWPPADDSARYDFGATGAINYNVKIYTGVYDVHVETDAGGTEPAKPGWTQNV